MSKKNFVVFGTLYGVHAKCHGPSILGVKMRGPAHPRETVSTMWAQLRRDLKILEDRGVFRKTTEDSRRLSDDLEKCGRFRKHVEDARPSRKMAEDPRTL